MTCAGSLPPTAHPGQVGLARSGSSGFLGKTRAAGKQTLVPCQTENCPPGMKAAQASSLHQQTISQITAHQAHPRHLWDDGMIGSSSEVIQQSSCWSPLQSLHPHFPSHIKYFNDFPEREQGMGISGTIIISSVVQQLPFFISDK